MKSVADHLDECLAIAEPIAPFETSLNDAVGCILAEDIRAMVDVPIADIAALDGYAVAARDIATASETHPVSLRVTEEIFASTMETLTHVDGAALRVGSGARLPVGADTVVPSDMTDHGIAQVSIYQAFGEGSYIRPRGDDMSAGDLILSAGTRLAARHMALLAAAGRNRVVVRPAPRVVIMSVGDELVKPGQPITPGKVYDANSNSLEAAAKQAGAVVYRVPTVSDDRTILRNALEDQLLRADVIITTGGLSYGGGDTVKEVLSPLGSVRFHNVAMNPGRQLGVGTLNDGDTIIFCLPGDPATALVVFEVFVRPALKKMAGYANISPRSIYAAAATGFTSTYGMRDFVPARVGGDPTGGYGFEAVGAAAYPLLSAIGSANGIAVVPEEMTQVTPGTELECIIFAD